jgi:hypothetical protein
MVVTAWICRKIYNNNSIQFNSIYLRANLTAQDQIIKIKKKKNNNNNNNNNSEGLMN